MDKTVIFVLSVLSMIATFILVSDWTTYSRLEKAITTLQILEKQKEKNATSSLEVSQKQTDARTPRLLNPTDTSFRIATLCTASNLLLEKIQFAKSHSKVQDKFEILLALRNNYKNFTAFINELNQLPWSVDWKSLQILSENNEPELIKIKVKLTINAYYLPKIGNQSSLQTLQKKGEIAYSPFTMTRHIGKITTNNQTMELIFLGQKQNILRVAKAVLN